ncbi:MAG: nitroreductase family protein [Burkholderiales bacterium]|nr:nitroreductase family protein [Burkholderiales bacterium]
MPALSLPAAALSDGEIDGSDTRLSPGLSTMRSASNLTVQAPTAMHLEPWAFAVVQDQERLKRHSDRAKAARVEQGSATDALVQAGDPHPHGHLAKLADPAFNFFCDVGTLVVICRKSGGAFADADCWLAAENPMLA